MISSFYNIKELAIFLMLVSSARGQLMTINNLALTTTSGMTMTVKGDVLNQNGGTINNAGNMNVSGNWTNNAANNVFSAGAGTVMLNGTSGQTIGGSNSTTFYNLTLNNSSATSPQYTLGLNQNITNTLALSAGNTNLAGDTITLGNSVSVPGSLSYTAGWMYGGVIKRWFATSTVADGSATGLFPLGTSTDTRPLYVSAPSVAPSSGGTITVSHTGMIGSTPDSFVDSNETIAWAFNAYWSVTTGNGLAGGTYNMRVGGTGFTGITDSSALRIVLPGGAVGIFAPNGGTNANPQVNRINVSLTQLSNSFHIGYPSGAGPLPVSLLEFDAKPEQLAVKVHWQTASEINSDYFTVERSADGKVYNAFADVPAAGNSTSIRDYSLMDNDPLPGISYYRLKETDFDGNYNFYPPVEVDFENIKSAYEIVSTQILNGQAIVRILSSVHENFDLYFYDSTGRLISHINDMLTKGYQDVIIPLSTNASGIYLLSMRTAKRGISKKIF